MGRAGRVAVVLAAAVLFPGLTACIAASGLTVANKLSENVELFVQHPGKQPELLVRLKPNTRFDWDGDGSDRLTDMPDGCDSTGTQLVATATKTTRQFLLKGPLCANQGWDITDGSQWSPTPAPTPTPLQN